VRSLNKKLRAGANPADSGADEWMTQSEEVCRPTITFRANARNARLRENNRKDLFG